MQNINLYFHADSKNHGCEAIVRSTVKILADIFNKKTLYSQNPTVDRIFNIGKICPVKKQGKQFTEYSVRHFCLKIKKVITNSSECYVKYNYKYLLKVRNDLCLSIGGDNYCYGTFPETLGLINQRLIKNDCKTILWGCSLEPDLLKDKKIVEDLSRYSLITARESITYHACLQAGVSKNIKLYPDPAFQLDRVDLPLPSGFAQDNTVGINISPLIMKYENNSGMAYQNYEVLMKHIIDTTKMQIALIPHVVQPNNDDRVLLKKLYESFRATGRVVMIEDQNCMELKGFIARCRMFIGARTHATIAAYSTGIPTLVVGYSVKSKGIAKDIFGSYENYVISVQSLKHNEDLIHAFEWLKKNEDHIRNHLNAFMPAYCAQALKAGEEVKRLLGENH